MAIVRAGLKELRTQNAIVKNSEKPANVFADCLLKFFVEK